jgi:hypothetical protein
VEVAYSPHVHPSDGERCPEDKRPHVACIDSSGIHTESWVSERSASRPRIRTNRQTRQPTTGSIENGGSG